MVVESVVDRTALPCDWKVFGLPREIFLRGSIPSSGSSDDRASFEEFIAAADRALIQQICDGVDTELRLLLPVLAADVQCTFRASAMVIPETGEMGGAFARGNIFWNVDPARAGGVAATVKTHLRPTLFHECHHLARGWVMQGGEPSTTFMRGVVSEGLATAFERDFARRPAPWGEYPRDVRKWVDELLSLPVTADYQQWMFQHPDGRRWIGYRAGTFIADEAIRASGTSAADLVQAPTEHVLRLAGIA